MPLQVTATANEAERHLNEITGLAFHDNKLYSVAEDGKVKVWSPDLQKLAEFQAHDSVVFHVAVTGNKLYTCSNDSSVVQAWNASSYEKKKTLLSGDQEVWRLYVDDGKLFAGDVEGKVHMWSSDDELLKVFELTEEVRGLAAQGSLLYTVRDRDLIITEMLPGEKSSSVTRKTIEGSSPMCLVGTRVCFATRSGMDILVHENNKHTCFKELGIIKAHDMIMNALCSEGDSTVYSGGYDCKLKKWDASTLQNLGECNIGLCINEICVGPPGLVYVGASNGYLARIEN